MDENKNEIWTALASYINGNASNSEKESIDSWLKESRSNQELFELLKNQKFTIGTDEAEEVREKIFDRIQMKMFSYQSTRSIRIWQYAAAASMALLITVSGYFALRSPKESISFIETKCPEGSRSTVTLDDGTIVELNSGSRLKYPAKFYGKERNVELSGEAFFEVSENKKKPFVVKAGILNIRVLGTKFNVKAYSEDDRILTTLLEGSVQIETGSENNAIVLKPNEQAVLEKSTNKLKIQTVNAELHSGWKQGSFYFDSETLADIAKKLEREFNVTIHITTPELNNVLFSGVFDKGESITKILDMLRKYRNFNYRITNNNVELYIDK